MLKTQAEYNCLLRYGNVQGFNSWFWTDGMFLMIFNLIKLSCSAYVDEKGVWVHAYNNRDVSWFSPKWNCHEDGTFYIHGGDAMEIYVGEPRLLSGSYCDADKIIERNFICEKP